jgi:preprotein translocase subunit SecA
MRLFNSGMVESFLNAAKIPEDVPIEHKMVTRAIASAQSQVEARNFEIRKNVLKYDDVLSTQREVIYAERRRVLEGEDLHEQIRHFLDDVIRAYVVEATGEGYAEDWNLEQLWTALRLLYPVGITVEDVVEEAGGLSSVSQEMLISELTADAHVAYDRREESLGGEVMRELERRVVLAILDRKWREHLYEMDYLQEGIGLRAMAQRDPLVEYQREGFLLFQAMTEAIKEESVASLFNVEVQVEQPGGAEGEEAGEAPPVLVAKGLVAPAAPAQLQYSAPTVDGDGGRGDPPGERRPDGRPRRPAPGGCCDGRLEPGRAPGEPQAQGLRPCRSGPLPGALTGRDRLPSRVGHPICSAVTRQRPP